MKAFVTATAWTILAVALHAQGPSESTAKPAKAETDQNLSDQEMNTRAYIQLLRSDARKAKSQVMGDVMQLDADESAKFWPIYKEFEGELTKIGDQIASTVRAYVENYDKMTDPIADKLANKVLGIEQQRNALKKKYYDRVKGAMGAVTAMRFLQVENQLERIIDLQVAAQLPVQAR